MAFFCREKANREFTVTRSQSNLDGKYANGYIDDKTDNHNQWSHIGMGNSSY
jgi:hypothetical protein